MAEKMSAQVPDDLDLVLRRMNILVQIAQWLSGTSDLSYLQSLLNRQGVIPCRTQELPQAVVREMALMCRIMRLPAPREFTMSPMNSPAVLIHWRALIHLIAFLTREQRDELEVANGWAGPFSRDNLAALDSNTDDIQSLAMVLGEKSGPIMVPATIDIEGFGEVIQEGRVEEEKTLQSMEMVPSFPECIVEPERASQSMELVTSFPMMDSHFHLDRSNNMIWGMYQQKSLKELLEFIPAGMEVPEHPVQLKGGVLNYCDPETYYQIQFPEGPWKVAVGFHPAKAHQATEEQINKFEEWLRDPRVAAVGEVGLDRHRGREEHWPRQEYVFRRALENVSCRRPLILHLREKVRGEVEVSCRARELCAEACGKQQAIHLHCFGGPASEVAAWGFQFPQTYFSFGGAVRSFTAEQIQGLRAVPRNRLLVETDSPYLHPRGSSMRINTPIYLGDVASLVAEARGMSLGEMAAITLLNTSQLYSIYE